MSHRGEDFVVFAEELADRFGFGRGLNNNEVHKTKGIITKFRGLVELTAPLTDGEPVVAVDEGNEAF